MCRKSLRRLGIRMILPEEEEKALEEVSEVVSKVGYKDELT